jgi:hypothetical protein
MTDLSTVIPLRYKTIVGLIGSIVTFAVPLVISVEQYLPSPWPAVIGALLSVLTALGIYKAPYKPEGTALVPNAVAASAPPAPGEYKNPWQ